MCQRFSGYIFWKYLKLGILLSILFSMASCKEKETSPLLIATSANMQFAMQELVNQFEKQTNVPCEIVLGSSGKLSALILEGAPYHLFVSADMNYPLHLFEEGKAIAPPKAYALGKLVLWSMKDSFPDWQHFKPKEIQHFAIPNPKVAPYGSAAIEALKQAGLYEQLSSKLVLGENVAQTTQYITSGAAEAGIVSKSIVSIKEQEKTGFWCHIPESDYTPVSQGVVLLKSGTKNSSAIDFYNFLFSIEGKRILNTFGYDEPAS